VDTAATERQRELDERLGMPEALLSRTELATLGLPRRGVDAVTPNAPAEHELAV
jgi:hypothetical protein